jgi:hypothetical protein
MRVNLRDVLTALDRSEREALLVASIIERDRHDLGPAVLNIFKVAMFLAQQLNAYDRYRISEIIRDLADDLEHNKRHVVVS